MQHSPRRLLVLDDDPTGSQCIRDVTVAFTHRPELISAALDEPGSTCFVLTNSRSMSEEKAREVQDQILGGLNLTGVHVVSRSDSTLRGHVIAEPAGIIDALARAGQQVDGILFCPAMIEAGRFTEENIHYAMVSGAPVPVGQTDFAQDATFGYRSSDLRDFLVEKSGGSLDRERILSLSAEDISQGVERVQEILLQASDRQWVIINATSYVELEVVADALTAVEAQGKVLISRCGPSWVRPLAGRTDAPVLSAADIVGADQPATAHSPAPGSAMQSSAATDGESAQRSHGLVVVGSHIGLTTAQLGRVQARSGLAEHELDVGRLLDPEQRDTHIAETIAAIRKDLQDQDTVVYTSRERVSVADTQGSLDIATAVSNAVVDVVAAVRSARPAWVVAKGGITSHEVAHRGLGIELASVAGQFFPGQISLFHPEQAPAETMGIPYVVFPGNVGSEEALADVIETLRSAIPG